MITPEQQFKDNFKKAIEEYANTNQYTTSKIPVHAHTGTDTLQVNYKDLVGAPPIVIPVADGTYITGAAITLLGHPGSITTKSGIITAVTQAT